MAAGCYILNLPLILRHSNESHNISCPGRTSCHCSDSCILLFGRQQHTYKQRKGSNGDINLSNEAAKKNKITRVITGTIISLISIAAIVLGSIPLFILLLIIITLCSREFVKILRYKGFHPSLTIILFSAVVFATLTLFHRFDLVPSMLTLTIMASFLIVLFRGRQPYIVNVATTILGALYCGWLPCHILLIRQIGAERVGLFEFFSTDGLYLLMFVYLLS